MKLLSLFVCLLLALGIQAQTKKLADFSKLKVNGRMHITLNYSDSNFIEEINKDENFDLDKLELVYKGEELIVKYLGSTLIKPNVDLVIFTKNIKQISAHQGAEIIARNKKALSNEKVNLEVFAGGTIELKSSSQWIEANIKQGGTISLTGDTKHLDLSITTGGYIAASFLKAQKVKAEIKFGGEIICHPIEYLDVQIVSGGEVNYQGNPEVNKKIKLGGKVNQL